MKKAIRLSVLLFAILFAFVSCSQEPEPIAQELTPTIRGSVSIPEGSELTGSDFFIRIMEGEKAVYTGRVNTDGSFSVPGLSEEASYSILLTTEEPGDIKGSEKDISRAVTSGYGGWLSNVTASVNEKAGVGSVKVKPLGTIKGIVTKDGATDGYDTTVYIPGTSYLAMTDGQGNFSIFNVPQATYTLRYISNGYMAKMVNDVVLYSESDTENPVTTVAAQKLIKNAGNLLGTITKTGSTDHSNITVRLSDGKNTYTEGTATDGTLLITGIEPGTYTATISSSGFITQTVGNIKIEAAKDTTISPVSLTANGGDITGTVSMNDGGEKAGVIVSASSSDGKYSYTSATDTNGRYTFTNAYPGTYTLTLTKTGYAIVTKSNVTVVAGQSTQVSNVSFSSDYGTVTGRVIDTKNAPLENAIVKIGEISVFTGTDGRFSKTGIGVGNYSVTISKDDFDTKTLAQTVTVSSSETTDIGTVILTSPYGSLTGTVSINDGSSPEGIPVTISREGGASVPASTDAQGRYSVTKLQSGTYTVKVELDGYSIAAKTVSVAADAETKVDVLALNKLTGSLKVTVVYADNATKKDGITVSVFDSTDAKVAEATTTDSLNVTFTGIAVGTNYRIVAEAENYASSARTGITVMSALETSVSVPALTNRYGTVSGRVTDTDGSAIANAIVKIGDISVFTDDAGCFTKSGIAVGNYAVTVSKDGYTSKTLGEKITVEASAETEIGTVLLASEYGKLTGLVTVNDGGSSAGISVRAVSSNGNYSYSTLTDGSGSYVMTAVQPGTYTVTAQRTGYSDTTTEVEVMADRTAVAATVMLLSKHGSVSGKVTLAESADNSGVTVTLTYVADMTIAPAAVSGADGTYTFSNLTEAGQYTLTFSKDGYVSDTGKVVNVNLGQNTTVEDVTLRSLTSTVTGKVTLEGTENSTGVSVLLKATDNSVQYDATTDQQGNYVMARVNPGEYTLTVSKSGYVSKTASDIIVESSTVKTLDAVSLVIGVRSITGSITAELKTDYSGFLVTATNLSDETKVYSAITNTAGAYTLAGMVPGEYSIVISHSGYRTLTLPTVNVIEGSTKTLESSYIEINRGTISGVAILEGRTSSSGISIELLQGSEVYETTATDVSGAYSFYVPQGNYSGVRMSKTDFKTGTVSASIALFADNYIAIDNTELKATANTVHGTVDVLTTDDESAVTISFDGHDEIASIVTGANGLFSFAHVPVGTYTMRFSRENCSDILVPVSVIPADSINLGTVTITPNTASITGKVDLVNGTSLSGVLVSVDMGDKTVTGYTDASGRYEIGGISVADTYTVTYSKAGWDSKTQQISPKLERLEIRELDEITLVDTTAPVLNSVVINSGANTAADRNVTLHFTTTEQGSGVSKVMITYDNVFDRTVTRHDYLPTFEWELPPGNGEKTIYVRIVDAAGNESNTVTARVTLTDQKKEVSGVLTGDDLHWTEELSPYLVIGNILVESGKTLIIDSGVDVQFAGQYYLKVEGTITVNGTEEKQISFYGIDEGTNTWLGINCANNNLKLNGNEGTHSYSRGSYFSHVRIENCLQGLSGYAYVENSSISASDYALGATTLIFSGMIRNCDISGKLKYSDAKFYDNTIQASVTENNTISYFEGNRVSGSSIGGIYGTHNTFTNSDITFGRYLTNSLFVGGTVSTYDFESVDNVTFENCGINLYITSPGIITNCDFSECTFESFSIKETIAINFCNFVDCSQLVINDNRISSSEFDFKHNFWGYDKTREMNEKGDEINLSFITDYYDDFNKIKVVYSGWVQNPFKTAGYRGDEYVEYIITPLVPESPSMQIGSDYSITNIEENMIDVSTVLGGNASKYRVSQNLDELLTMDDSEGWSTVVNNCASVCSNLSGFYWYIQIEDESGKQSNIYKTSVYPFVIGPAGGYVFYDKGDESDGWRFLEAAPANLRVVNGVPTVDSTQVGYSSATRNYVFGYYRTTDDGVNLYVNGTTIYDDLDCTGRAIGTGRNNTTLLVATMGDEAYSSESGSNKTEFYAARLCDILTYTFNGITYDDWFLPSKDELNLMYLNLRKAGIGNFSGDYYWSSSEQNIGTSSKVWKQYFYDGAQNCNVRSGTTSPVRAVRAF